MPCQGLGEQLCQGLSRENAPGKGEKEGKGQSDAFIPHRVGHKHENQHLLQFQYTGMDDSKTSCPPWTPNPGEQAQLCGRHKACTETQFGAETQGNSSPSLSSPKTASTALCQGFLSQRRITRVATQECTRVFSVQQEVHKLCHAGGRAWSNIRKYYCSQEQNCEENKMDAGQVEGCPLLNGCYGASS